MVSAEATNEEGGVIIMVAGLADGTGGAAFYKNLAESKTTRDFLEKVAGTARNKTIPDQWESQVLARILSKHHVIMVSDMVDPEIVRNMHMEHATNLEHALSRAHELRDPDAKIAVIPNGLSVIVS